MLFTASNFLSEWWEGVDRRTVREDARMEPLISPSVPFSSQSTHWPFPHHWQPQEQQITTSNGKKKKSPSSQLRLSLARLAGFGDGHRSDVSALIFPLYLPWPDNVNPLMKLLWACLKPLSSRGKFLFSLRHMLPPVMSAPVMATSLCLRSLFVFFLPFIQSYHPAQFWLVSTIYIGNLFLFSPQPWFIFAIESLTFGAGTKRVHKPELIIRISARVEVNSLCWIDMESVKQRTGETETEKHIKSYVTSCRKFHKSLNVFILNSICISCVFFRRGCCIFIHSLHVIRLQVTVFLELSKGSGATYLQQPEHAFGGGKKPEYPEKTQFDFLLLNNEFISVSSQLANTCCNTRHSCIKLLHGVLYQEEAFIYFFVLKHTTKTCFEHQWNQSVDSRGTNTLTTLKLLLVQTAPNSTLHYTQAKKRL